MERRNDRRHQSAPFPEPIPLSDWDRAKLWIAANRSLLGKLIIALAALMRVVFAFKGVGELAEVLTILGFLIGGFTWGAGAKRSDEYFAEKKQELETIPPVHKAKLLEVPHRRKHDLWTGPLPKKKDPPPPPR